MIDLKVKRLHPNARLPEFKSADALCFDIYALDDGTPHPNDLHGTHYRTGLAFDFPPGWGLELYSRSGDGFHMAVRLSNCVGLIDPDFRGELKVSLHFDASGDKRCPKYRAGDRIAQAKLVQKVPVRFVEVDALSDTVRGSNGFGSSGA